jgi:hypothetical protein
VWGVGYWYLIGKSHISFPLVGFYLLFALLFVWVARNLPRGNPRVLWTGRILGVPGVLGALTSIGNHSLVSNRPGILALLLTQPVIALVIAIALVLPGVGKAPTLPFPASGGGK